jgi:predicted kinase
MKQDNFYTNSAWRRMRLTALRRDHFRCTVCGVYVGGKGNSRVDHIQTRREHPELELELSNLRTFCALHDNQRHWEKGGGSPRGCGPDGWPTARDMDRQAAVPGGGRGLLAHPAGLKPSTVPLVVVTGAPASGKSTWVETCRGPDDLIIDLDEIGSQMAGCAVGHHWPRELLERALRQRNALLAALGQAGCTWPRAWFIVSEPLPRWREWWEATLEPERIVVMDTPMSECVRRAKGDRERVAVIMRHFAQYRPRVGDTLVRSGEVQSGEVVVSRSVWV